MTDGRVLGKSKRLLLKSRFDKLGREYISAGITPEKRLNPKLRKRPQKFCTVVGILPVNEFSPMSNSIKFVNRKMPAGMVPDN